MFSRYFNFSDLVSLGFCFEGEGGGGGGSQPRTYTEAEVTAIRSEGAGYKTKYDELEGKYSTANTELEGFRSKDLSEQQKIEKRATDAETERDAQKTAAETRANELKQERLERKVEQEARKLNIVDEDAALRLLDQSKIEFDDKGQPKNIEDLLTKLIEAKPYLVGSTVTASGSATNPNRPRTGDIDAQIAAAIAAGDRATAITLKRQKMNQE